MTTYRTGTKTRKLWEEQNAVLAKMRQEYNAAIVAEFPEGTRVRWVHTYKGPNHDEPQYRHGEVVKSAHGCLYVRIKPGGPLHSIPAKWADIQKDEV